jgi:transcriptional regulator with XRE-family HTH domain
MKRTDEDQQFGMEFAKRLRPFYEGALALGQTEKEFAKRLGVDRGGLQRYLRTNAMPSFRTIVLAYREFGISIPYAGTEPGPLISRTGRRRRRTSDLQMDLPLTIEAPQGEITVVIKKKTPQRIRLQLRALKARS